MRVSTKSHFNADIALAAQYAQSKMSHFLGEKRRFYEKLLKPSKNWRSTQRKRVVVKQALWNILQDVDKVERIFRIIERHEEY